MITIPINDMKAMMTDPNGANLVVDWADKAGRDLKETGLTTAQIRALFGEVRQIQGQMSIENGHIKAWRRVHLLKPKMAYRARKERGQAVRDLVSILDPALNVILQEPDEKVQKENFKRFVEFFEAILAYHKSYGGN